LERTHPTYLSLPEQWEEQVQAIQSLTVGQAFIRLPDDRVKRVRTPQLPRIQPDLAALEGDQSRIPHDLVSALSPSRGSPRASSTFF
jgi:hypothetical protein